MDVGSIYLIRHGQASFGAENYDVLSSNGVRQAQVLGEYLLELGVNFDRCISGSLQRQQDTARATLDAMQQHCTIEIDAGFNELVAEAIIRVLLPGLLPLEPQAIEVLRNGADNRAQFQRLLSALMQQWVEGRYEQAQLQSWPQFLQQVKEALTHLLSGADNQHNIAVFTSGGTLTALLHLLSGVPAKQAFEMNWHIVNTSLSLVKFRDAEANLASFNSYAHLQLRKAPELITYR